MASASVCAEHMVSLSDQALTVWCCAVATNQSTSSSASSKFCYDGLDRDVRRTNDDAWHRQNPFSAAQRLESERLRHLGAHAQRAQPLQPHARPEAQCSTSQQSSAPRLHTAQPVGRSWQVQLPSAADKQAVHAPWHERVHNVLAQQQQHQEVDAFWQGRFDHDAQMHAEGAACDAVVHSPASASVATAQEAAAPADAQAHAAARATAGAVAHDDDASLQADPAVPYAPGSDADSMAAEDGSRASLREFENAMLLDQPLPQAEMPAAAAAADVDEEAATGAPLGAVAAAAAADEDALDGEVASYSSGSLQYAAHLPPSLHMLAAPCTVVPQISQMPVPPASGKERVKRWAAQRHSATALDVARSCRRAALAHESVPDLERRLEGRPLPPATAELQRLARAAEDARTARWQKQQRRAPPPLHADALAQHAAEQQQLIEAQRYKGRLTAASLRYRDALIDDILSMMRFTSTTPNAAPLPVLLEAQRQGKRAAKRRPLAPGESPLMHDKYASHLADDELDEQSQSAAHSRWHTVRYARTVTRVSAEALAREHKRDGIVGSTAGGKRRAHHIGDNPEAPADTAAGHFVEVCEVDEDADGAAEPCVAHAGGALGHALGSATATHAAAQLHSGADEVQHAPAEQARAADSIELEQAVQAQSVLTASGTDDEADHLVPAPQGALPGSAPPATSAARTGAVLHAAAHRVQQPKRVLFHLLDRNLVHKLWRVAPWERSMPPGLLPALPAQHTVRAQAMPSAL